ncbi:MAG: 50S ribosomal protein L18Ae [Promethearchaeota archaeon]
MTDEIKIFKISGNYVKKHQKFNFTKYIRALTAENALDKALSIVTSQKILRRKISITENKPIKLDECPDLYVHELSKLQ